VICGQIAEKRAALFRLIFIAFQSKTGGIAPRPRNLGVVYPGAVYHPPSLKLPPPVKLWRTSRRDKCDGLGILNAKAQRHSAASRNQKISTRANRANGERQGQTQKSPFFSSLFPRFPVHFLRLRLVVAGPASVFPRWQGGHAAPSPSPSGLSGDGTESRWPDTAPTSFRPLSHRIRNFCFLLFSSPSQTASGRKTAHNFGRHRIKCSKMVASGS